MKGVIKFYNQQKSFGFIKVPGGKDVFVHKTALLKGETLKEGDNVEFTLIHAERGDQAEDVRKI